MQHWELLVFFFAIAFVYASVGFGGGSSYLAILALYNLPFAEMRLTALICNVIVVTGGSILYIWRDQVSWRKVVPLVAVSVPLAFVGAQIKLSEDTFFIILGCCLIVAAILLWIKTKKNNEEVRLGKHYVRDGAIGGGIGFLSGMVGIGGGIFLSPALNLVKWDTAKRIAATASLFILANSVAGITGQLDTMPLNMNYTRILLLCAAVLVGGQLGSRTGLVKFDEVVIKRVTAVVVFAAGTEVLYKHLHWFN